MTLQEIYNTVRDHLLKQMAKATTSSDPNICVSEYCLYRAPDGRRCAVGCLIKDEFYSPNLEKNPVARPNVQKAVCQSLGIDGLTSGTVDLLGYLQCIHDSKPTAEWCDQLTVTALKFNLVP